MNIESLSISDSVQDNHESDSSNSYNGNSSNSTSEACNISNGNAEAKRPDYLSWDEYFMSTAFLASMRSKDPATQVGAAIVNDKHRIVGSFCLFMDVPRGWQQEYHKDNEPLYI